MKKEEFIFTKDKTQFSLSMDLRGRVDSINAPILQRKLNEAISSGVINIILNMKRVEFLSSAGMRAILQSYKTLARTNGTLGIEEPSEEVKKVLGMAALKELMV